MFELKEPTRGKLQQVADKAIKVGQRDTKPAVILTISHHLPNSALEMFDPALRTLLFSKASPGEKTRKQAQIEGIEEVSDLPALTRTGVNIASLAWGEEQSGCAMVIDYGTGDERSNIVLRDGTTKGMRITLQDGGSIKLRYHFHAPVDSMTAEQVGKLHLLHQRDVTVTLAGPKVDQADIEDEDQDSEGAATPAPAKNRRGGTKLTPIQALAKADKDAANSEGKAAA